MRRLCGSLTLSVPEQLEDQTYYVFEHYSFEPRQEGEPPCKVTLEAEPMSADITPRDMVNNAESTLGLVPGFSPSLTRWDARAGAVQASVLEAEATVDGFPYRRLFAAFRWSDGKMVSLCYETVRRADARAVFSQVLSSIREYEAEGAAAPGYVRQHALTLSLELPAELASPGTYFFAAEEERVRLLVMSVRGGGPVAINPGDWLEVAPEERLVVETVSPSKERQLGGLRAWEALWRADLQNAAGQTVSSTWFRQLLVHLQEGSAARVLLIEARHPTFGERYWPALAAGIELKR